MQDSDSGEHIFTICLCPPSCFLFCFVYHFIPVVSFSRSDFLDQHEEPTSRNVPVTLSQNPPMDVDAESGRSAGDHIRTGGRSFFLPDLYPCHPNFFSSAIGNDAGGVPADVIGAMKRVSIDGNRPNDDNGPSDAPTNQRRKETNSHSQEEYVFVL